jgi:hypothetical protein
MTDIGRRTRLMAMESTLTPMALNTKGNGLTISNMAKAKRSGQMELGMRALTSLGKKTDSESFCGLTDPCTREILWTTIFTGKEPTNGPTEENS